jgi:actin-related protein 9
LKRSGICEILLPDVLPPGGQQSPEREIPNPAAAVSTGAIESGTSTNDTIEADVEPVPRGPGEATQVGEEGQNGDEEDREGVLDVASIVARGNPSEILAKREKERLERAAAKKAAGADTAKQVRLKNSERSAATFSYEDYEPVDGSIAHGVSNGTKFVRRRRRDVLVGVERFMAASPPSTSRSSEGILDTIATTIHNTILSVPDVSVRSTLWENLIILGNGSRVRGTSIPRNVEKHD